MKKRLLSVTVAFVLVTALFAVPVFAYSNPCEDINFNKLDASDWTTAGTRYGTISNYGTPYPNVVTYSADTLNDRDGDGKSLKVEVNANSGKTDYPGIKYTPEQPLKGIVHISASNFVEAHEKTSYIYRYISMVTSSGEEKNLVTFTDAKSLMTFLNISGYKNVGDHTGAWIDVDIVYNLDTNCGTYNITSNGTSLFNQSFTLNDETYKDGIAEIKFFTQSPKWLSTKYAGGTSAFANKEVMYWDNIRIETLDKMPSEASKTNTSDFNSYTPSDTITSALPSVPSGVAWKYANVNGQGFSYEATDKGVSMRYTGSTTAAGQLRMNFSPYVSSVKSKFSFKVADKVSKPIYIITGDAQYIQPVLIHDSGRLIVFGNSVLNYETDRWYDVEYSFDAQSGDYYYRVYDGENEYMASGELTQEGLSYPNTIQRVMLQINKASSASSILIDDFMLDTVASDFRLDKDLSSNNKTIINDEAVYARFTKELDETGETLVGKVFEYYGNAEITSVSLLDKYTIKVDFKKELGKKYRIDFKNIAASDGSMTSDYIEISTEPQEYIAPVFTFTDDSGNKVNSLTKGTAINMSTVLKTGTEGDKDAYAFLALYDDGGKLCGLDFNKTKFTREGESEELSVSIPSGTCAYRLFAAVWNTDLKPIKKEVLTTPVVIFKLDDLRAYSYPHFLEMTEFAEENEIKIGVGIIANTLENAGQAYMDAVKAIDDSPNAEIWCHGYTHSYTYTDGVLTYAEFTDSVENQSQTLKNSADILKNKCGITVRALGTPGNYSNADTIKALELNPQYTTLLASASVGKRLEGSTYIHLSNWMNMESSVDVVKTLDALKANYESSSKLAPYVLIAGHSYGWDATSEETFKNFIDYLKSKGVTFMTPTEYYNFVS